MKKNRSSKIFPALLAVILMISIFGGLSTTAYADSGIIISFPANEVNPYSQYMYPYAHTGTVICRKLTVRAGPSMSAQSYGRISNGKSCKIIGRCEGWLILDLASCDFAEYQSGYGFVKEDLVKQDPYWIAVPQYTNLYATPWQNANLKNGEQDNRVYFVIEEQYPFYAVQCCEDTAGTSFIYMQDVVPYSPEGQDLHVCVENEVPVYDAPWGEMHQMITLEKFTIVDVVGQNGNYFYVTVVSENNYGVSGWVEIPYIQDIIN